MDDRLIMTLKENPQENFERILYWQHLVLKLIGVDGFGADFRRSAITYFFVFLAGLFFVISVIDLVLFRQDIFNFTFVMVTIFYALVGFGRLSILVRRAAAAAPLVQHMKTVYRDASRDPKETLILQTYTNYLEKSVIFYSVIFMGGVVLTGFLPLAVYLWTGNKILPFGVVIPFVDPETPDGYQMNYMYQVSFMLWTPPGLIASQSFYFALSFNICIQFDVLVVKLQGVDNLIANNVNGSLDGEIRTNLITVIKYQQRLVQFISDLEDLYAFQTFLEVACNALQIVMTLFVLHIVRFLFQTYRKYCSSHFQFNRNFGFPDGW